MLVIVHGIFFIAEPYYRCVMISQVRRMREAGKTVVASMCDQAASGGYYIAMGCEKIVCDDLSITGSIGVVSGKFTFGVLAEKARKKLLCFDFVSCGQYRLTKLLKTGRISAAFCGLRSAALCRSRSLLLLVVCQDWHHNTADTACVVKNKKET